MPDLHPYFKDVEQAWEWYPQIEAQLMKGFELARRDYLNIVKVSSDDNWDVYKNRIIKIAKRSKKPLLVDVKNQADEKYWIVDIDYGVIDKFEQYREIGCIQIDVGNASRLGISYQDSSGEHKNPVIIHAAIPGGIERYIYMLVDNFDDFPIEFAPIQLRLIPVGEKYLNYAEDLLKNYPQLRIDIDDRALGVSKRIKMAHEEKIPHIIVVGEKEEAIGVQLDKVDAIIQSIHDEIPFLESYWPKRVSKRVG